MAGRKYRCEWCDRSWRTRLGIFLHWAILGEVA